LSAIRGDGRRLLRFLFLDLTDSTNDEPWKREARGEEPAVAPAAVAQRPRGAKAAPGRKAMMEETVRSDGFRTPGVPQKRNEPSLERVAGTPGSYRPSRVTRRNRFLSQTMN